MSSHAARGAYLLLVTVAADRDVEVGALGTIRFEHGTYVYVGSAMGGLEQRVVRHLRRDKRMRWHIDRLLDASDRVEALLVPSRIDVECELASLVEGIPGAVGIRHFGCSDCRCRSHLFRVSERIAACLRSSFPEPLRRVSGVSAGRKDDR